MMHSFERSTDQFLKDGLLQPKFETADYVGTQGIAVPQHFSDIEGGMDLLAQGTDVIARTEHPLEYHSMSGLGDSRVVVQGEGAEQKLKSIAQSSNDEFMRDYAVSAGIEPDGFISEATMSFWEYIRGTNITMVADDVVSGRYHMFGLSHNESDYGPPMNIGGAVLNENGDVECLSKNGHGDAISRLPRLQLIQLYEQIRTLDKFDPRHCPIMEMQIGEENDCIYFLQYHRSRDEQLGKQILDPRDFDIREGWLPAQHVRGALLGSQAVKMVLAYGDTDSNAMARKRSHAYLGVDDIHEPTNDLVVRSRTADILPHTFDEAYTNVASSHAERSRLFKPQATLLVHPELAHAGVSQKTLNEAKALSSVARLDIGVEAEVISDGYNGFVRPHSDIVAL